MFIYITGTDSPSPCPAGTFNPEVGRTELIDCQDCTAGQTCSNLGLISPDLPCKPGHYCPGGNSRIDEYPCVAGTYTDWDNLTASDQCISCPQSVACLEGTGGVDQPPVPCATGHFCTSGTGAPDEHPCPAGTWTNLTNLYRVEDCYNCPKGWWCSEGQSAPEGICDAGHWCPLST